MELVLVANAGGEAQFLNIDRVHDILGPTIIRVCQMTEAQATFFLQSHTSREANTETGDLHLIRKLPDSPTLKTPPTPPGETPGQPRHQVVSHDPPSSLGDIPLYNQQDRPLRLVELCGGIAT